MRIIAGEWRGRRLEVPKGIRPMLDRERERMFAMLGDVEGPDLRPQAFHLVWRSLHRTRDSQATVSNQ